MAKKFGLRLNTLLRTTIVVSLWIISNCHMSGKCFLLPSSDLKVINLLKSKNLLSDTFNRCPMGTKNNVLNIWRSGWISARKKIHWTSFLDVSIFDANITPASHNLATFSCFQLSKTNITLRLKTVSLVQGSTQG